ncbi:unnamed protein product [Cylicocyclus nassatus]|uniref:Uncharacterized protein n=1 Tax=Cylicocyclus nassatus TaxID=53992 RepID=A0AA36GWS4_CYLNA|nr:unnamed protein product [Cylicocyclus nassatus]
MLLLRASLLFLLVISVARADLKCLKTCKEYVRYWDKEQCARECDAQTLRWCLNRCETWPDRSDVPKCIKTFPLSCLEFVL